MARRGLSDNKKRVAALEGGRRMVAPGERPVYRLRVGEGDTVISEAPWLTVSPVGRGEALDAARAVIAAWLDVGPDTFDVGHNPAVRRD